MKQKINTNIFAKIIYSSYGNTPKEVLLNVCNSNKIQWKKFKPALVLSRGLLKFVAIVQKTIVKAMLHIPFGDE